MSKDEFHCLLYSLILTNVILFIYMYLNEQFFDQIVFITHV